MPDLRESTTSTDLEYSEGKNQIQQSQIIIESKIPKAKVNGKNIPPK